MTDKIGVARLRQAIENQATAGEMSFSLPFDEADALLRECESELPRGKDGRPSDEERREVAENLRNLAIGHYIQYKEQFFDKLAEVVVGFEDFHYFDTVLDKLADLIDLPTCEMKSIPKSSYRVCTRCGAFVRKDAVTNCTEVIPVRFCPNCGAEVVE